MNSSCDQHIRRLRGRVTAAALWGCNLTLLWLCGTAVQAEPNDCRSSAYYYSEGNNMALATSVFGAVSLITCGLVIILIMAYRKEQHDMRERVILGLMIANSVYSVASVAPAWYVKPGTCEYLLTITGDAILRGLWFMGSYWMVCYEIMIVGMAIPLLLHGTPAVSWRVEKFLHVMCFVLGVAALVVWYSVGIPISQHQQKAWSQVKLCYWESRKASNTTDVAVCRELVTGPFANYASEYVSLVALFARIWISPMIITIGLFVISRYYYHRLVLDWLDDVAQTKQTWERDLWVG